MDMSQYLEIFIEESKEHLQNLNESLLQLEKDPNDSSMLNEIFRVAHTLKGMAGTMGFSKMSGLTHDMENVLHALRNNEIKVTTKLIDLLFKCLDALEKYLNNIINFGNEGNSDCGEIIKALENTLSGNNEDDPAEDNLSANANSACTFDVSLSRRTPADISINQYDQNVINKAIEMGMNVFRIAIYLNKGCVLKSARAFIIFQTLEKCCDIIKSVPKVEDIEDEKFDFEFTVLVITKESSDYLQKQLNSISEVEDLVITEIFAGSAEVAATYDRHEGAGSNKEASFHETNAEENKDSLQSKDEPSVKKPKTGKTVRVDIDRLDVLMNLVSELIIQKTRLEDIGGIDKSQTYNEALESLERITTDLHDAVMKVRMVPVETVFNRFPRMIRDISRELGKEINLTMSGEETELDRTVIDEIGEPLIHLLRNSADHGIEPVEKRKEAGKTAAGNISLKAYQDGNNVVIEVSDDGQGINIEKVKKKAIEKGLVNKEIANSLSKKDIIDFLFKPSFSTADKVTDLSGRGVGLDVVKTKIEALGGNVEVDTELGQGSRFIIRLPLTLAIIQALLVVVGNEKYAIPLNNIKEIINISPNEVKFVQKQEVFLLRNMVVPVVRLDKVLDVPAKGENKKQLTVVIVKKGEKLSGLVVDSLIGQQEIVQKSLGKLLQSVKLVAGATILGDGNVALILDINSIV